MRSRIFFLLFILGGMISSSPSKVMAQETPPDEPPYTNSKLKNLSAEDDLESELDEVNGKPIDAKVLQPLIPQAKKIQSNEAARDNELEPQFVKPPAPDKGGILKVPHPNAGKGLIKINKDGSYQYRTEVHEKSKSSTLKIVSMTPPEITGGNSSVGTLTYKSMYGSKNVYGVNLDYEWQPFRDFGRLGIVFGTGISSARANGYFKNSRTDGYTQADEVYTLYILPASLFISYRFEYKKRQWIVPFVNGGATAYGLVEARDDGTTPHFAVAPAVGGGGGLMFSITALDAENAFILDRQYGVSDMYFTIEARVMQGLDNTIDFTSQSINAGVTVDF